LNPSTDLLDTPTKNDAGANPISEDMDSLGKALVSGDLKAAQDAYAKIQEKISQGPPAGQSGGARKTSASGAGAKTDSREYDKKDINKDGTVSLEEEMAYRLNHLEDENQNQESS
jgi:hypothetical protein